MKTASAGFVLLLSLSLLFSAQSASSQSKDLSALIDEYAKSHDFHGTVLVQNGGVIECRKSYGLANRQFKVPNRDDTRYKIASITKMFTAVLTLQLVDEGRLDLDATIHNYLPGYTGEAAKKVTIHQLLNHTSGMKNMDENASPDKGIVHYQTPMSSDELLRRFYSEPLVAQPGKSFDYNNADYIVLGKIVEALHGKPFDVVLSEKILTPLDMNMSGMLNQPVILENLADTYFFRDDLNALSNDLPVYMENWYAAGGMYSTAADLLKFSNALYGDKLIKRATLDLMIRPGLDDYGYGVWIDEIKAGGKSIRTVRRPGRIMGAQTMLIHYLDANLTIVVLSNAGTTVPDDFAFAIGNRILDRMSK